MTVTRVGYTNRYAAYAADAKPIVDTVTLGTIPVGSKIEELDTGIVSTWDGSRWLTPVAPPDDQQALDRLDAILAEMKEITKLQLAILARLD